MAFLNDAGMTARTTRLSLAVAGVARGDVISITNSRWSVSRTGLSAMLFEPPIILNDFAARAWALTGASGVVLNAFAGSSTPAVREPGMFCLIGIGMELGVAAFVRNPGGLVMVIASEAGASTLSNAKLPDTSLKRLQNIKGFIEAYTLLSGIGLVGLAGDFRNARVPAEELDMQALRAIAGAHDLPTQEAVHLFCDQFWDFAVNLVLSYGAWDGLILTGEVAELLKRQLANAARDRFARGGAHSRLLRNLPLGLATFAHGELAGASMALRAALPTS